jgi:hypothetical protein
MMTDSPHLNTTLINPNARTSRPTRSIELFYQGDVTVCELADMPVYLGRDSRCALTVDDDMVSREHCYIGFDDGRFVLFDQSTNGTYVRLGRSDALRLHNESIPLSGSGCIKLGRLLELDDPMLIYFKC